MSIKLIAMDLDGTLLNSDKLITPRTMRAVHEAARRGVSVTIATGRMFGSAEFFGRMIRANVPLICCNGGLVQGMGAEQPVFVRKLPEPVVRRFLLMCHEKGWYVQWYVGNEILAEEYRPEFFYAYRTVKDFTVREVGENFLDYTEDVIQCVVRSLDGSVDEIVKSIRREFADSIFPQQQTGFSADLTPPGVHKGVGLEALAKHLGVRREEVMACGDSDNDLEMLRWAGIGVVPANARPEAKALADYLADSNDEDGIGKAIEELVLQDGR